MHQANLKRLLKAWILLESTRYNRETGQNLPRWKEKLAEYERRGDFFVHFSSVPRMGLVTRNRWGTPIGFYSYPLNLKKISDFATERKYAIVFKPRPEARLLDLLLYTEADYERDVGKLSDWGFSSFSVLNAASDARVRSPGGKLWNVTRVLSGADKTGEYVKKVPIDKSTNLPSRGGGPTGTWTMLLKRLGYDGVLDDGDGIIHNAEPSQAVFFDTTKLDLIEIVEKETTSGNLRALLNPEKSQANADFSNSVLQYKDFSYGKLPKANFSGSDLANANFEQATLVLANFQEATLTDAAMFGVNATNAKFTGANLAGARFPKATLTGANFAGATLSMCTFSSAGMRGANFTRVNGEEIYCRNAHLAGATFDQSNISYSNFGESNANKTSWRGAKLAYASLDGALLQDANFQGANLEEASFTLANLVGADLSGTTVSDADFTGARYDKTTKFPEGFDPVKQKMKLVS